MKTYRIEYTRIDKAQLEWREWAFGYPFKNAESELKRLKNDNKDFDFRMVEDSRT